MAQAQLTDGSVVLGASIGSGLDLAASFSGAERFGTVLRDEDVLAASLADADGFSAALAGDELPAYPGPWEFTPDGTGYVFLTSGMKLTRDIVVSRIPGTMGNNWGRITYDQDRAITVT